MNNVVLMGRLTKDPEVRYTQSAEPIAVANYTLAVNRRIKTEGQPDADFIPCVVFGKQADFASKYFKKGMMVAVSGRIQVRSWDDQTGQKRWSTEVILDNQEFAESKSSFENRIYNTDYSAQAPAYSDNQSQGAASRMPASNLAPAPGFSPIEESIDDGDLPF